MLITCDYCEKQWEGDEDHYKFNVDGSSQVICEDCDVYFVFCAIHGCWHDEEDDPHRPCHYLIWSDYYGGYVGAGDTENPDSTKKDVQEFCASMGSKFTKSLFLNLLRHKVEAYRYCWDYRIELNGKVWNTTVEEDSKIFVAVEYLMTLDPGVTKEADLRVARWILELWFPAFFAFFEGWKKVHRNFRRWGLSSHYFWSELSKNFYR